MRSPDAVREHERGVVLAITVLVATTALAVVIGGLLLVGCAVQRASGTDGSEVAPPPLERPERTAWSVAKK